MRVRSVSGAKPVGWVSGFAREDAFGAPVSNLPGRQAVRAA